MAVQVDLRVRRELLDPKFDGYKLSLDILPIYTKTIANGIEEVKLSDDQVSYHHAKLLGVHNHLVLDPWDQNSVYFVDKKWNVVKNTVIGNSLTSGIEVFQIPDSANQKLFPGRINISLQFVSEDRAVLCDGAGRLYLLDTSSRSIQSQQWKVMLPVKNILEEDKPLFLLDAVQHSVGDSHEIECLLVHVEESTPEQKDQYRSPFLTVLEWISFTSVDKKVWTKERTRQLIGRKPCDYAAIDRTASSLIIASEGEFKFVSDSLKPVVPDDDEEANGWTKVEAPVPDYTWNQTDDALCAQFTVPSTVTKSDVYLTLAADHIDFGIKNGDVLLKGQPFGRVDVESSTWIIEGQSVELQLSKEKSEMWPEFVIGDTRGEMVLDPDQVAEIHKRLAHLTSEQLNPEPEGGKEQAYNSQQLEDCDLFPGDEFSLMRIAGDAHNITHKANLGSHQWLFNARLDSDKPMSLCLRHDVDGLVWQPQNSVTETQAPWEHVSTFNAFGYVQASKQQRKYTTCPPNCSYVAVSDSVRHIYIYRQPSEISSPVRNRKTGQQISSVAQQQVVALESVENILGFHATNDRLFVVTTDSLYMVQVNNKDE